MEIKTKFNAGDKAYFMGNNKVYQGIVKIININIYEGLEEVKFKVNYVDSLQMKRDMWFNESELFPTKEELLKSL